MNDQNELHAFCGPMGLRWEVVRIEEQERLFRATIAVHQMMGESALQAMGVSGWSRSKQVAKNAAARAVLNCLREQEEEGILQLPSTTMLTGNAKNPVQDLKEWCDREMKRTVYRDLGQAGTGDQAPWVCELTVTDAFGRNILLGPMEGIGRNKKLAKAEVARMALVELGLLQDTTTSQRRQHQSLSSPPPPRVSKKGGPVPDPFFADCAKRGPHSSAVAAAPASYHWAANSALFSESNSSMHAATHLSPQVSDSNRRTDCWPSDFESDSNEGLKEKQSHTLNYRKSGTERTGQQEWETPERVSISDTAPSFCDEFHDKPWAGRKERHAM